MDILFIKQEMATSDIGGKMKKKKLDETRVDLIKRKQVSLLLFLFLFIHLNHTIFEGFNALLCLLGKRATCDIMLMGVVLKLGDLAGVHFSLKYIPRPPPLPPLIPLT